MPSSQDANDMKEDLTFKERAVGLSKDTHAKLRLELKKRNEDLEKIQDLDKKISLELSSLNKSMAHMETSIVEYKDIEGLRETARASCERYRGLLQDYISRKEQARLLVDAAQRKVDAIVREIKDCPENAALKKKEERIRTQEQEIYRLKEHVQTFERDADFNSIKRECLKFAAKINEKIMETESVTTPF